MKKKAKKKLLLSKETIASLKDRRLIEVAGGSNIGTCLATGGHSCCTCPFMG